MLDPKYFSSSYDMLESNLNATIVSLANRNPMDSRIPSVCMPASAGLLYILETLPGIN